MYDPHLALVARSDAELLRIAALRLSLLLSSHTCREHGDECPDRERAEEVIEEIGRRFANVAAGRR